MAQSTEPKPTRPRSSRTRERALEIVTHIASGLPLREAASRVGLDPSNLWRWRRDDEELDRAVLAARATFLQRQVERIDEAAEQDWKAAAWLLERSEPAHWDKRVEVSVESEGRAVVDPLTGMVIERGMDPALLRLPPGTDAGDGDAAGAAAAICATLRTGRDRKVSGDPCDP